MDIVNIKVADIKPYPKNTKKHPAEQISNIAKSIEKYGFIQPIVLDKNNEIVIGHGRILASKKLKMQEVPCVYAENLSKEDIKALRIIDNKLNESEWDPDFLKEELADIDLSDFDLDFDDVLAEDETEEGAEIVLDVFGGSGSTLIACEQTGRTCYMAELSPEYVDVIIARWEKLTGQKAELLNGVDA